MGRRNTIADCPWKVTGHIFFSPILQCLGCTTDQNNLFFGSFQSRHLPSAQTPLIMGFMVLCALIDYIAGGLFKQIFLSLLHPNSQAYFSLFLPCFLFWPVPKCLHFWQVISRLFKKMLAKVVVPPQMAEVEKLTKVKTLYTLTLHSNPIVGNTRNYKYHILWPGRCR